MRPNGEEIASQVAEPVSRAGCATDRAGGSARNDRQRGSASVLLIGVVAVCLLTGLIVADVAVYLRSRAAAVTAADAAALAAAPVTFHPFGSSGGPVLEARRFAEFNGAHLESCTCPMDSTWSSRTVGVVVSVPVRLILFGDHLVSASAVAEFDPVRIARPATG